MLSLGSLLHIVMLSSYMSNTKPEDILFRFLHREKLLLMLLYMFSVGTQSITIAMWLALLNGEKSYLHGLPFGFVYNGMFLSGGISASFYIFYIMHALSCRLNILCL
jgi:hypothetical protein